ncbi:MAG: hypothetical protein OXG35_06090, partial [Acidobacteria bacterium]|nr:hypothetical protein [Acidobacteriota bacterium]
MTGDRHPADAPPRDSDRDAAGTGDADPVVILPPPTPATEELFEFVATHEMTMEELLSGPPEQPGSEDPAEAPPEPPRGATPPAEPEKEPFDTVETDLSDRVQLAKASLPERPELDFPDELDELLSGREPLFVDTVELTEDKLRAGD